MHAGHIDLFFFLIPIDLILGALKWGCPLLCPVSCGISSVIFYNGVRWLYALVMGLLIGLCFFFC